MAPPSQRTNTPVAIGRMAFHATAIISLLLLNKGGPLGAALFFALLIGMIVISPELAFKALTLNSLGLVCNQAIVPKTPIWTVARFVLPMLCLVRFSIDMQSLHTTLTRRGYYVTLIVFVCVVAILSIASQYFVEIALLKLFNFTVATTAMFSGAEVLRSRRKDLTEWYVTLSLVTVALGFGSIVTGIGNNMRGTGTFSSTFNGPFYHSNAFGPLAAMMVVYLACFYSFGKSQTRWISLPLAGCLLYFMVLTQSRTAFASMFVGVFAMVALTFTLVRRGYIRLHMNVSRFTIVSLLAAAVTSLFIVDAMTGKKITNAVVAFANKGGKSLEFDVTQALSSRQEVVEASWQNFLNSPLIGIGFEVAKTDYFVRNASLFYAPIEKGFLPVAVLEETGLIGTFFFTMFLFAYLASLVKSINVPGITMFLTFLAVNCGEAIFFSVGGHGGFGWLWFIGGMMLGFYSIDRISPPSARVATS